MDLEKQVGIALALTQVWSSMNSKYGTMQPINPSTPAGEIATVFSMFFNEIGDLRKKGATTK